MKSNRFKEKKKSSVEGEVLIYLKKIFTNAEIYTNYPLWRILDCSNRKLSIDFFIGNFGILIEYHGEHHYNIIDYGKDEKSAFEAKRNFENRVALDKEKENLIKEANFNFVIIPCFEWKKLKEKDKKDYLWKKLQP